MRLFAPAAHAVRLSDHQVQELYPRYRWQILESTFIGYATFYFVLREAVEEAAATVEAPPDRIT